MSGRLEARVTRRYAQGPTISAEFELPAKGSWTTVLFGPSGCGKTTILRCLAGLERPDDGRIACDGKIWFDSLSRVNMPPQKRNVGLVFQDYALFPHLSAAGNIAFGLRHIVRSQRSERVRELLTLVELNGLDARYPSQLSGGQQQRLALARALARQPGLLLLDEPLAALDALTRDQIRDVLRRVLHQCGTPAIMVTHDRHDALAMADQIVVMDEGQVLQIGDVPEVFSRPTDLKVARIVGTETVASARLEGTENGLATVAVGQIRLRAMARAGLGERLYVCIRAEDVVLERNPAGETSARNHLAAKVQRVDQGGPLVRVYLDCGFPLVAAVTRVSCEELHIAPGETLTALVKAPQVHLISRDL